MNFSKCVVFVILPFLGWTCLNKKKLKKISKSENFSQKIHVYELFPQSQKFLQLDTEVQPVKEHVMRNQKYFQTNLNLRFFAITAKWNKNKIFYDPSIFAKGTQPFCLSFFHFSSKRFKTLAFTFWIVMLLKNLIKKSIFWLSNPLKKQLFKPL